jgi:S-disulfanyl-L-cysteine oxidoreductase SoxD
MYKNIFVFLIICTLALAGLIACNSSSASSQSPVPPLSPTTGGVTYGSMAQQGQQVFMTNCTGCHGAHGEGITAPAIIGAGANLGKYNTAAALFSFVSTAMPLNAPGSLSRQDYLNVLCYLLVQNNYAFPTTKFNEADLNGIQLK